MIDDELRFLVNDYKGRAFTREKQFPRHVIITGGMGAGKRTAAMAIAKAHAQRKRHGSPSELALQGNGAAPAVQDGAAMAAPASSSPGEQAAQLLREQDRLTQAGL